MLLRLKEVIASGLYLNFGKVFTSNLANNFTAFLITLSATKTLDANNFGVLTLLVSFVNIGSMLLNFGGGIFLIKSYKLNQQKSVFNLTLIWNIIQGVAICFLLKPLSILLSAVFPILEQDIEAVSYTLIAMIFLNIWITIRACDQASENFTAFANNTFLYSGLRVCAFLLFFFNDSLSLITYINSIYVIPLSIVIVYNLIQNLIPIQGSFKIDKLVSLVIELINYGKWVVVSGIAYVLISRLPQMKLAHGSDQEQLALYGASLTFLSVMALVNDSVRSLLLPKVIGLESAEKILSYKSTLVSKLPLYSIICSLAILSLVAFQYIFMGNEYQKAIIPFLIQSVGLAATMYLGYFSTLVHRMGKPYIDTVSNILRFISFIILIEFIPKTALWYSVAFSVIIIAGELLTCFLANQEVNKYLHKSIVR